MIDRKQIKATAKARMAQSEPGYWKVMLVYALVAALVPQLVLNLASGDTPDSIQKLMQLLEGGIDPEVALRALQLSAGQLTASWALNLALSIFQMVLGFGLTAYCLRLYRGQECGFPDLFTGFSMAGRVIGQQILVVLIALGVTILITFPMTMVVILAVGLSDVLGGTLLIIAVFGGAILLVLIMLNYVLATLALADQPDLGAMGAIQYGRNLIRGHKGQYVVLGLSFFGWALLCSLLGGIFTGVSTTIPLPLPSWSIGLIDLVLMLPYYLWLTPYVQTSLAGFYDALRQEKETLPPMPPL